MNITDLPEPLASNVVEADNGCWLWTRGATTAGYALLSFPGRVRIYGHRMAYESVNGPIPDGLVIDHWCHSQDETCLSWNDCRHRRCVRPDHLRAVTQAENIRSGRANWQKKAQTHCKRGHELSGDNLIISGVNPTTGYQQRQCRACDPIRRAPKMDQYRAAARERWRAKQALVPEFAPPPGVISREELSERTGYTVFTISKLQAKGVISPVLRPGRQADGSAQRCVYYPESALDVLLERRATIRKQVAS